MKKVIFLGEQSLLDSVYSLETRWKIATEAEVLEPAIPPEEVDAHMDRLSQADAIFTTWGMPLLSEAQLAALPRLKAVFYAAGSVRLFARPLIERDIMVVSSWVANAIPVAEFTLAQILLSMKGYFRNLRDYNTPEALRQAFRGPGNYGETVAILGAGAIGRKVIELLAPFRLRIAVFDQFLTKVDAANLGVSKVSLEEAFESGFAISNHLADVPETEGMLQKQHFARMRDGAVFINTGRGRTVREDDLCDVLEARKDLTALLDVTYPEPPKADSRLFSLPNALLSTHIAGSINSEVARLGEIACAEFLSWKHGKPMRFAISLEKLATMA
ncbi:phosphoglycerate dehydrogenase [Terrimicrobium sacchariphilum]|uniref:Phosphoglycerate dehydrogenase n=1 Tax=Terrimicrobium sacchariphilum TaxID=690879 RepID=A0A146G7C9_TERSA|nr:hydroxyacid dehydrogenase [Terrimicrobium sacchariphilum]GAT32638.1 phosphoglycerate dehydrogenase [Terrimicrobium sacchariphilum]